MQFAIDMGATTAYGAAAGLTLMSILYMVAGASKSSTSLGGLSSVGTTVAPYPRWAIAGALGGAIIGFIIENLF